MKANKIALLLIIVSIVILFKGCQTVSETETEVGVEGLETDIQSVSGKVYSSEEQNETIANQEVRVFEYIEEPLEEEELQLEESDTAYVATTYTDNEGVYSIHLPLNTHYVVESSRAGNSSLSFFFHEEERNDAHIVLGQGGAVIDIIDTQRSRETSTYGEPPRP